MQPVDSAGLPNTTGSKWTGALRSCPVCHEEPPAANGGVLWKWLAVHLASHLGYEWSRQGWATSGQDAASNGVIPQKHYYYSRRRE